MSITIEVVTKQHNRKKFDCGEVELNEYLSLQARQAGERQIAKTYVACQDSDPTTIIGYYTLTGYSVTIPPKHKFYKNYPHPLNAVKLGRLAVDRSHQKQKLGECLLIDALRQTVEVADSIGAIGLYVDPMTPGVVPFYEQYGFLPCEPDDPNHLEMWLPLATCKEVLKAIGI